MRFSFFCSITFCFCFAACNNEGISTQNFNTTILVTDMDNKPLAGQKVRLFITRGSITPFIPPSAVAKDSAFTDNQGKVKLSYDLTISESHQDFGTFTTVDDTLWKSIETQDHTIIPSGKKSVTQELTLSKDSLSPIRLRLQKTTATPWQLNLFTYTGHSSTERSKVTRTFFQWSKDSVRLFDTTFSLPIYSKSSIIIKSYTARTFITGGFQEIEIKQLDIKPADVRATGVNIQLQ